MFSGSVVSDSMPSHGLQHARLPCPSPSPRACSNSCPLSRWCHPTILTSVVSFSSRLRSFPASGSFLMSQLFVSVAKVLELQLQHQSFQWSQDWFPLGLTSLISSVSTFLKIAFSLMIKVRRYLLLFSHEVTSDSSWPLGLQHSRLPCPWPSPRVCSIHVHRISDAIQPSHPPLPPLLLLSSFSLKASGSFPMSWLFASVKH